MTRLYLAALLALIGFPDGVRADSPTRPDVTQVRFVQAQPNQPFQRAPQGPELLQKIAPRQFESITTRVSPPGEMFPEDQAANLFAEGPTLPESVTWKPFYWAASEIWHRPIYFQDIKLERYGQTCSPLLQPALSGAHFFGTLPILPYMTGLDRPLEPVSTLGYYRPGSPAPCVGRRIPWQWDAALIQAGAVVSGVFILP